MANVSILPFGGASSYEVAYVAGVNLMSNMYTAERMEAVTRFLLYPTITSIIHGLAEPEKRWYDKNNALANDASSPVAKSHVHKEKAERSSRTRLQAMETLAAAPGEMCQLYLSAISTVVGVLFRAACRRPSLCVTFKMTLGRTTTRLTPQQPTARSRLSRRTALLVTLWTEFTLALLQPTEQRIFSTTLDSTLTLLAGGLCAGRRTPSR